MNAAAQRIFEQIADGLANQGFAVIDGFLGTEEVDRILLSDEFKNNMLHFHKAGIGKTNKLINEGIRGDYIQWIDPTTASPAERDYLDRLKALIIFLNQNLFLSLKDVELHRTIYPVGAAYKKHLDQFRADDHRKLSIICYLNTGWKSENGGQLRMYVAGRTVDTFPDAGKLVCFRSDQIEHEVLPSTRERYSLTGWAVDRDPAIR